MGNGSIPFNMDAYCFGTDSWPQNVDPLLNRDLEIMHEWGSDSD